MNSTLTLDSTFSTPIVYSLHVGNLGKKKKKKTQTRMERQASLPEYNVFLQEHPLDPPDRTPTRRHASTDEPRTNSTDNSQTARPQRRSQPVTFFDGTTWGGATADPVVPSSNASTCPIQSDQPTNATPSNTNRVTRLRARQRRSPEPSHTRWEEVTWLIASLRDIIMRQEVKMEVHPPRLTSLRCTFIKSRINTRDRVCP
ncbi:hypothetical protein BKA66DRAFT_254543 [Pyrenochaeta sp. MPI-SDFR-AT-0127]|nr:hypothetical protein BKA66DRAFT_254543 [Pyrenochaeta sp. MPI-SDFR-AT-0127]